VLSSLNPQSPHVPPWQPDKGIPEIVSQHVSDVATLLAVRTVNLGAPHIRLRDLRRVFDDRLAAHLVGVALAGDFGWACCEAALETPSAGAVFTAAVRAIHERQSQKLDRLLALSEALPDASAGLRGAFGWLASEDLQGIVVSLLSAQSPFRRMVGIAACSMHRVDPALVSAGRISDSNPLVRARALRAAGEIGCAEAVPGCAAGLSDPEPECRFWAVWSSVLLGSRGIPLESLMAVGLADGQHRLRAFRLALQSMNISAAHTVLRQLAENRLQRRWVIMGSGIAGDPVYVPWLIRHMVDEKTARLTGEAVALITGLDIADAGLDTKPPEGFEPGPSENPEDPNVEMDPDEGLPWPDAKKVEEWWAENSSRFQKGTRYFMGKPVTREHCIDVLKNGYQRQRILAAHYLCLLEPGTPLFNTNAPAWRQERLLAGM
jgi:uncharacterized protein (TIGR02270 family)